MSDSGTSGGRGRRFRWSSSPVLVRDTAFAVVLVGVVQLELLLAREQVEGPLLLQHAAFAVLVGAIALRRRSPVLAAVTAGLALAGQTLLGSAPVATGYVALIVVVYSVATYARSRRAALAGLLAVLAGIALYPFTVEDVKLADEVVNAMIPTTLWALALVARERQDRAVTAERRRLEHERDAERRHREALDAERRRIAREVHDTVAHGLTIMLLQSELLRDRPGDTGVVDVVQEAGRSCLDDLRRLLVVLREDSDGRLLPASDTSQLSALLDRARAAGTTVRLQAPEYDLRLPRALDEVVFHVVQEALTNAVRYAGGSGVDVRWGVHGDTVEVCVENEGGAPAAAVVERGSGHGLLGLRERVALHGGTLVAGPGPDDTGWRVHASLPLTPAAATR